MDKQALRRKGVLGLILIVIIAFLLATQPAYSEYYVVYAAEPTAICATCVKHHYKKPCHHKKYKKVKKHKTVHRTKVIYRTVYKVACPAVTCGTYFTPSCRSCSAGPCGANCWQNAPVYYPPTIEPDDYYNPDLSTADDDASWDPDMSSQY